MYITNTTINDDNTYTLEIALVFVGMFIGFLIVMKCIKKIS